jgi:hypothetical protein
MFLNSNMKKSKFKKKEKKCFNNKILKLEKLIKKKKVLVAEK